MISPWDIKWVEVPITVTLDPYVANDVIGGTLSATVGQRRGGCFIYAVKLIDGATQAEPFTLYVFDDNPSAIADGDAHVPTEADWQKYIGKIAIANSDYDTSGTEADCAVVYGLGGSNTGNFVHADALEDDKLYFRLVPSATPDYAAADDLTMYVAIYIP
jgi:hypothetical protein